MGPQARLATHHQPQQAPHYFQTPIEQRVYLYRVCIRLGMKYLYNNDMRKAVMDKGRSQTRISGKALERYFALNEALFLFSDLFQEEKNERAAAIVGAAFLDTILEHILIAFMVDDEREVPKLLGIERPLATYGSRTTLAYCLGLIPRTIRDDLRLIGKIRNRCAHDLRASFDEEPIRTWCLSLKWHEISMCMSPPEDATPAEIFQVGLNQLVTYLNGVVGIARTEKRQLIIEH
jgi:hypothetical protein